MIPPSLQYGKIDFKIKASRDSLLRDFKPLMGLSNEIEDVLDPYAAADEPVRISQNLRLGKFLAEVEDEVQSRTLNDKRFLGLEHKIAVAVEKPAAVDVTCCTPGCQRGAVKNSHALQKNGVLGILSDASGRLLQTKFTPFSQSDPLKEIGIKYASVFPGYCRFCEQTVFRRAESDSPELDLENITLLLWRALCLIRFRRAQEVKARGMMISKPAMYEITKENDDPFTSFSSTLNLKTSIYSYKMSKSLVEFLERQVESNGSDLLVVSIKMEEAPFAGCGVIPVPIDFERNVFSGVGNFRINLPTLMYTTVVHDGAAHFVFACKKTDRWAMKFLNDLMRLDAYTLSSYLPQIVFGGSDTVFVSKDYWTRQATERDRWILMHSQTMKFPQMVFPFWGAVDGLQVATALIVRE